MGARTVGEVQVSRADSDFLTWLTQLGEENCREMTGPNFQSVFNRHMWASNAKLMNFYMTYGYELYHIPSLLTKFTSLVVHLGVRSPSLV